MTQRGYNKDFEERKINHVLESEHYWCLTRVMEYTLVLKPVQRHQTEILEIVYQAAHMSLLWSKLWRDLEKASRGM